MNQTLTMRAGARAVRTPMLLRWLALGIGAMIAMAVALSQSGAVGAAGTDGEQTTCIPINYTTCATTTTFQPTNTTTIVPITTTYAPTTTGLPGNALVTTYFDPRYCDGSVSIVTDSTGHAINICTATGQRIYPVFPDYGTYGGYYGGLYNGVYNNGVYNNGLYANNGFFNGVYNNGVYNTGVYNNGIYANGFYNGVYNTYGLTGVPAGYNGSGVYQYTDNRFCGDGQVVYSYGQYYCANGSPLYRSAEVAAPVAAPAPEAAAPAVTTQATTVAAPAAPVAAPLTTTAAPATVDAPAALPAQGSGLGTHAQGVTAPTTPTFAPEPTGPDARS